MTCFFMLQNSNNDEEEIVQLHDEEIAQIPRIGETISITEYETTRDSTYDKEIALYKVKDIRHELFCNKKYSNNWYQFIYIIFNKVD